MFPFSRSSSRSPNPESALILSRFKRGGATGIDLTLRQPYFDLLAGLGDPQRHLPPVVHVAGTNGKGSVCAFLRAMIEAAGFRVHVYTSPHLVTFHERIRIAGRLISEDELVNLLHTCERLAEPGAITYFEAATAAALTAFAHHPAHAVLLETGLGGRLDATNVIPAPMATIITRLSFDHREYLGTTMADIAREKAGIMRRNVPCFVAQQPSGEAVEALRKTAAETGAPLSVGGQDWCAKPDDGARFRFESPDRSVTLPLPVLTGRHQIDNAGLALAALRALPLTITDEALARAMHTVAWPGRLQRLTTGRLAALLPNDWELWLDGGHNDSAADVLATQMQIWRQEDGSTPRPLFLIMGMLITKAPLEFMRPLAPYAESWRMVPIAQEPLSRSGEDLSQTAAADGILHASPSPNLETALREITTSGHLRGRILICGSLYLAGEALRQNEA